ncbi:MAG: carbonic anhydrase [Actinomycetes bacterium]
MSRRRAASRSVVHLATLVTVALAIAACGGGDDASEGSVPTGSSLPAGETGGTGGGADGTETVAPAEDDGHQGGAETITITKEQFDELRLQVLELEVEVDRLQVAAGLTTTGETREATGEDAGAEEDAADTEAPEWSYDDVERWGELAAEFSACGEGDEQSPVDLAGATGIDLPNAVMRYQPADATIIDLGHTVQVNVPEAGTLELDGTTYQFTHLHFHSPSEHTVAGDSWPMEWHLVHRSADGALAVVAVLVEEGPAWPAFDLLITSLPIRQDVEDVVYGEVDVAAFLPEITAAYRYDGSLTTPPCTEGVSWSVLQGTITMSAEQMEAFASRLEGPNNRPTQPIGDRVLAQDLSA